MQFGALAGGGGPALDVAHGAAADPLDDLSMTLTLRCRTAAGERDHQRERGWGASLQERTKHRGVTVASATAGERYGPCAAAGCSDSESLANRDHDGCVVVQTLGGGQIIVAIAAEQEVLHRGSG